MLQQQNFFEEPVDFRDFVLPNVTKVESNDVDTNIWDIPNTIRELSYLTHSHYRYYGKFPSAVAGQLLDQYAPPTKSHYVLDNFCGSGTTLVEAKLRHVPSYGVDISWISALVSRVKCRHVDLNAIRSLLTDWRPDQSNRSFLSEIELKFANRWFSEEAIEDLLKIRQWIQTLPLTKERDFLLVGYLAIIRRVSRAFDGEVRPHINAAKKQRDPISAFQKKILDMIADHSKFQKVTDPDVNAECLVGNNIKLPAQFSDGRCYLAISHPPYLNSFNYRPVFSLEFFWGAPFEKEFSSEEEVGLISNELIAHPATENNVNSYFMHLQKCYRALFEVQDKGAKLAVVIGDCTRNGKLIRVVEQSIDLVEELGYKLVQKNFRTTHYGLGKYAYKHRADYHGEDEEKRDAILVFER
jgi:hypothetical protein